LLVEAVDEGLFTPHEHGTEEELLQQQQRLSADGIADGFLHVLDQQHLIPSLRPLSPLPSPSILTGLGSLAAAPSSILSPQPHSKQQQQQLLDQSPLIEHGSGRLVNRPQLQLSPDFNIGRTGSGEEGDEYDLARSEAERGQLKDIVLKFHRNRHALLSPPQEDDDLTSLMLSGTSANNRNRAPSPYPYGGARDELVGSGGAIGLAGDITMSPTPREAPKVCLSPYKRANLVYSGQHIHSSVSSSSSSSSSTPSSSSSSVPTRKALFNSGDALGAPSRHGIELGLLPSSSSPPLPMQREIVDKVKVALDEAMQSVKTRIIEVHLACPLAPMSACVRVRVRALAKRVGWVGTTVQLGTAAATKHTTKPLSHHATLQLCIPATARGRTYRFHSSCTTSLSVSLCHSPRLTLVCVRSSCTCTASPTSMLGSQSLDQRYEETRGTEQGGSSPLQDDGLLFSSTANGECALLSSPLYSPPVLSGRQMLRSSSSGVDQQYPLAKPSSAPPHALASSPTASPPFVPRDYH
jgi:hypothetical protein